MISSTRDDHFNIDIHDPLLLNTKKNTNYVCTCSSRVEIDASSPFIVLAYIVLL